MAAVPNFKRLSVQDFKNPPEFLPKLIIPFNTFAEQIVQNYSKGYDYDNFNGDLIDITFTTPNNYDDGNNFNFTPITFNVSPTNPRKCVIAAIRLSGQNQLAFSNKPVTIPVGGFISIRINQVTIQYITGLLAATNYVVTFDVF